MAVSGGGDSVALLCLLADVRDQVRASHAATAADTDRCVWPGLIVYTVDHQLRPEAAAEAAWVAGLCRQLGAEHRSLLWRWDGQGNLSDAARQGRYSALAAACAADGVGHCLLGHTRDDNIETLMLGLMRGAGLDGLAGMRRSFRRGGVQFHRPLLEVSRAELRRLLTQRGQSWHEDPTNQDLTHDRARVRHLLSALDLPDARLAQSLRALAATRQDLGAELLARLNGAVRTDGPCLTIAADVWQALTPEFRRRTLAAALRAVSGAAYAPRAAQLLRLVARDWDAQPGPVTLAGCRIWLRRGALALCREYSAVPPPVPSGQAWEGWRLSAGAGASAAGLTLGALGPGGHGQVTDSWRAARIPYAALLATPALWQGPRLVAAAFAQPKHADHGSTYQFIAPDLTASFHAAVMAH